MLISMFSFRCLNLLPSNFNHDNFNTFKLNGHRHEKAPVTLRYDVRLGTKLEFRFRAVERSYTRRNLFFRSSISLLRGVAFLGGL